LVWVSLGCVMPSVAREVLGGYVCHVINRGVGRMGLSSTFRERGRPRKNVKGRQ